MIPMSDTDVQDVRNLVAKQNAEYEMRQKALLKMKKVAERTDIQEEDVSVLQNLNNALLTRQEKERRLGMQRSQTTSKYIS
ncbi:hypothetical protein SERLA73DRAFT_121805 [Serpula lacrymans var. lacrymans S7.3]|uniref:No apical meristem-associated C-terminal domain-containing protein n=2 Tax=Serpula lacrymans var. lacrymans TaxID=341189 RepID=F8PUF8_SERL3|nr:hypothetical protein SERLA73DRAFT_121805 [Serpula lacrymans var. lacrymans S7.3]